MEWANRHAFFEGRIVGGIEREGKVLVRNVGFMLLPPDNAVVSIKVAHTRANPTFVPNSAESENWRIYNCYNE